MAVATSLLRDEHSPEIDRRVRIAIVVALLFHVPVFVPAGGFSFGTSFREPSEPALNVRLDPLPEPEKKVETASAVSPEQPPPPVPVEPAPSREPAGGKAIRAAEGIRAGKPEATTIIEDEQVATAEPQLDGPDVPTQEESPARIDSTFAAAQGDDSPDELPADAVELADEPVPETQAVVATVAPAQERVLTGRLEREARELLESSAPQRELTFRQRDREYTAKLKREPSPDGTGIERVTVEITTDHGGERVQTRLSMRRLAFSHFTQLVDHWDPMVQLHDDEIAGRFHSNSEINVAYDRKVAPRLLGKVTTARRVKIRSEEGFRSQKDIFAGGLDTRTPRIRLPQISLPVAEERSTRNADVHVVRGDALIIFYADGSYTSMDLASKTQTRHQLKPGRLTYVVGTRDTELHVRGIVNGSVTVYSPRRIVVRGNLTYAHVLRGGEENDFLGLVSDGNVEIDSPKVTGPGNLEICAAVYARERFVVRSTATRRGGTLIIRGSLTAGSLSETEPRYATRLEFDPRFERVRPPGFPETDRYEIESWDGRWRASSPVTGG
jgi:hypothetical protein